MPAFVITVLGSGTSMGVPTLGCDCKVCTSSDPRDSRLRPSIMVQYDGYTVIIDTTPDFRQQALREKLRRIDAILNTHAHADHIMGLDDIRPINLKQRTPMPIYGSAETLETIKRTFAYVFAQDTSHESTVPKIEAHTIADTGSVELFGATFQAILLHHGRGRVRVFDGS
jgi:phosphoribosyl 1,2-cyclic phosphate phosphodiesterase